MIRVEVKKDSLIIKGHANFDDYGKDIVCAAVSSVLTTSVNDMHIVNPKAFEYTDDGKTVTIDIVRQDDLINKLFNNLIELLVNLSEDYPKNIKVEREG